MRKKQTKKWRQGSFVVEASFVMPLLILIVFVCIALSLYLHDRSVLAACAAEMAGKGASEKYRTEQELETSLAWRAETLAQERLLACKELEASVKATQWSVTVCFSGSTPLLSGLEIQEEETAKRLNPTELVRGGRQLKDLLER